MGRRRACRCSMFRNIHISLLGLKRGARESSTCSPRAAAGIGRLPPIRSAGSEDGDLDLSDCCGMGSTLQLMQVWKRPKVAASR